MSYDILFLSGATGSPGTTPSRRWRTRPRRTRGTRRFPVTSSTPGSGSFRRPGTSWGRWRSTTRGPPSAR
ncbi:hypothetical protein ACFQV4_11050 [Streptomyces thermocarboxydus]